MSYTPPNSKVSTLNSTTNPLGVGSIYTGTWEDVSQFQDIIYAIKTDQNGTITVQFSPDATNVDATLTSYYRTAQIEPPHRYTVSRQYMRITFTNTGVSSQTYIRLQTMLGPKNSLNAPVDGVLSGDNDATVVRPTNYIYESALGRRQGAVTWNAFGYNSDADIGSEMIWYPGGNLTRMGVASNFIISSTSAQDTLTTGTGAWNVVVYYINSDRIAAIEVVALNGVSTVATVGTGLGINRVALYNTGSGDINAGDIIVTGAGTTQAFIPTGEGTTQQAVFFTQAKSNFLMDYLWINCTRLSGSGAQPTVIIKGWVYSFVSTAKYLVYRQVMDTAVENTTELHMTQPLIIGEKSVLWFDVTTDTNNTTVSCRFSGIEIRDVDYS